MKWHTSPISCNCWTRVFKFSSPESGLTFDLTYSTNCCHDNTGNDEEDLLQDGSCVIIASRKPLDFGKF